MVECSHQKLFYLHPDPVVFFLSFLNILFTATSVEGRNRMTLQWSTPEGYEPVFAQISAAAKQNAPLQLNVVAKDSGLASLHVSHLPGKEHFAA